MQAAPMGHQPTTSAMSSSSTLWAQASKEWVIPSKPKAGRKPKTEPPPSPPSQDDIEPLAESSVGNDKENKSRRVQNRAAQRAFRERKQSQLADLRARIQAYEQGEVERNVALQNVAKRLKEENETLRQENARLKAELAKRATVTSEDTDRKRGFIGSLHDEHGPVKKSRTLTDCSHETISMSAPSDSSSPDSFDSSDFTPLSFESQSGDQSMFPTSITIPEAGADSYDASSLAFECGLCNHNMPCVCREMAEQVLPLKSATPNAQTFSLSDASSDSIALMDPIASVLDNLPAYQPPVPLRRRVQNSSMENLFPLQRQSSTPTCSGDPSNCQACADDAFGQAFCQALGDSVGSTPACSSCPNCPKQEPAETPSIQLMTQPLPDDGASITLVDVHALSSTAPSPAPSHVEYGVNESETIPCNEAWRRLKSHPNIAFADLTMLAEVVARRTKCTGPRISIAESSASSPHDVLFDTVDETPAPLYTSQVRQDDAQPILLVDPHAQYYERKRTHSPPRLVPQDVLVQCRKARLREVEISGVSDALRLLDAQFGRQ